MFIIPTNPDFHAKVNLPYDGILIRTVPLALGSMFSVVFVKSERSIEPALCASELSALVFNSSVVPLYVAVPSPLPFAFKRNLES